MASVSRLSRELHPLAWWGWAVGLATAASTTTNPLVLLLIVATASVVVLARRTDQPWARVFRLYLLFGVVIVVVRVFFRLLVGGAYGTTVLVELPEIPLPDWVLGIRLLGPVTQEALLGGLYDGMRLATIIICVGAANALVNPKRLLACLPAALYEVCTALVVAVTVVPQLADSVRRVRAAQRLRPSPQGRGRRHQRLRRVLVPVLEDALDRSLALAAGMDVRGYGRSGGLGRRQRLLTGALMLGGLLGIATGVYGVLDTTAPRWLAAPMLVVGVALAVAGLLSAGRRVGRTRYRRDPWRWPEWVVVASGIATAGLLTRVARDQPLLALPSPLEVPTLSVLALLGALLPLVALVAPAPPLVRTATPAPPSTSTREKVDA